MIEKFILCYKDDINEWKWKVKKLEMERLITYDTSVFPFEVYVSTEVIYVYYDDILHITNKYTKHITEFKNCILIKEDEYDHNKVVDFFNKYVEISFTSRKYYDSLVRSNISYADKLNRILFLHGIPMWRYYLINIFRKKYLEDIINGERLPICMQHDEYLYYKITRLCHFR